MRGAKLAWLGCIYIHIDEEQNPLSFALTGKKDLQLTKVKDLLSWDQTADGRA